MQDTRSLSLRALSACALSLSLGGGVLAQAPTPRLFVSPSADLAATATLPAFDDARKSRVLIATSKE